MVKANSKQARENLKGYIMKAWNIEEGEEMRTWEETKADIVEDFHIRAYRSEAERRQNRQEAFKGWLQGLPRNLGDFYLSRAVDDLGDILEETDEERNRYSEDKAEEKLAYLIYREVTR